MRGRVWSVLLLVLSVVFIILLTQFVMAATGLNRSVEKLKDDQQNNEKSKAHFVLIAQEYGNPYWASIEKGALEAGKD